jgi:hypothetical protein
MDPSEEIIDEYFEYLADRDVYRFVIDRNCSLKN